MLIFPFYSVRMISLAAQKFVSDIANDALQHCKMRGSGQSSRKSGKVCMIYCSLKYELSLTVSLTLKFGIASTCRKSLTFQAGCVPIQSYTLFIRFRLQNHNTVQLLF